MNLTDVLLLTSLTGTALMAGLFFAFGTAVMGSLERMPEPQGAQVMNTISVRIMNPLFLTVFTGTALVCLALVVLTFVRDSPGRWWQLTGALLYLAGCFVVTMAINVPLNNQLAAADLTKTVGAEKWHDYLRAWNPANGLHLRNGLRFD